MRQSIVLVGLLISISATNAADYPIRPVPFTSVEVGSGFWRPRMETNRTVTIPYCFERCEETGRISNFVAAAEKNPDGFEGIYFNDSDVFKIVEGAAYALALKPDPKLDDYLDDLIAKFAAAQEPDGYLYTVKTSGSKSRYGQEPRWTGLGHSHELYNVGHMYEAAVAHYQATGKRNFLDIAIKNADLIAKVFGPKPGQRTDVPGHEEIEIGLVRLARATGNPNYFDLAKFFVQMRGNESKRVKLYGQYAQDHAPVVGQSEAVGHAVRGGYFYAGVADVAALTEDQSYIDAIDRIWQDVVSRKLYLIGSVGQHGAGEGYAGAYQLTNLKAYNETCAAIALAMWNHRMFLLHGDSKYADVLERILYNGFLSGVSLSGDQFFYPNPLECDMQFKFNHGDLQRSPWFGCSCCPSNVVRFLPSIPGYAYAVRDKNLYVNLFLAGQMRTDVDGGEVKLKQDTNYPWSGKIRITVTPEVSRSFSLRLRIPGWVRGEVLPSDLYQYEDATPSKWTVSVNGKPVNADLVNGYAVLDRQWEAGDLVELDLPMPVRRVLANEQIEFDRGRVAIERGPLVYCIEGADHDGKVLNLWLPDDSVLHPEHHQDLLGGVTVLRGEANAVSRQENGTIADRTAAITFIPYFAWCHRGANEMRVWIPRSPDLATVSPIPTIASTSKATASHKHGADTINALADQILPANSIDHEIPRFTWWNHRGTQEWVQYELDKPTMVSKVAVYWFDDTGRGACRVPKSWKLLYRDGDQWKPVDNANDYRTKKDEFIEVQFTPVQTSALRIQVQLQPSFSGGILEWQVQANP
ncbi:Non-reducing end beta-L-arabinofuranosidase [Planctomycetes bacterium CA13]|uniref:Non-reducing end beta-L-arabinofuranosidase n=1 Tax=Novipirellula herctigrandis TaxID=2527986 RepID=A0A5C5Z7X7_9BACT|nr:Non-reducing end beta-L-arabinofuranosidase [Planctomycetes bacterium CA13]